MPRPPKEEDIMQQQTRKKILKSKHPNAKAIHVPKHMFVYMNTSKASLVATDKTNGTQ